MARLLEEGTRGRKLGLEEAPRWGLRAVRLLCASGFPREDFEIASHVHIILWVWIG
jgi:hypothetical protein